MPAAVPVEMHETPGTQQHDNDHGQADAVTSSAFDGNQQTSDPTQPLESSALASDANSYDDVEDAYNSCCNAFYRWNTVDRLVLVESPLPPALLAAIRTFWALGFALIIFAYQLPMNEGKWFIFLTYWSLASVTAYFWFVAVFSWMHVRTKWHSSTGLHNVAHRTAFFLFHHALVWEIIVVPLYWATTYDPDQKASGFSLFDSIVAHGISLVALLCDLCISRITIVWVQTHTVILLALVYAAANGIYTSVASPVYSILKWDGWFSYVLVLILLAIMPLLSLAVVGCVTLRERALKPSPFTAVHPGSPSSPLHPDSCPNALPPV